MADITKCKGTNCPIKDSCFRYVEKESENQSWFATPPIRKKGNVYECDFYWSVNTEFIYHNLKKILKGEK